MFYRQKSTWSILWGLTKEVTKFTYESGKFIVKNTPTALGVMCEVKKEVSKEINLLANEISLEIEKSKREEKEKELDQEILKLLGGNKK